MLEEEYEQTVARRRKPFHLRKLEEPEPDFAFSIRPATTRDLPDVREIYNLYVTNSMVTFDDDTMSLREWRGKFAYITKLQLPFLVAVSPSNQVLGYAICTPWKQKRSYRFTAEDAIYLGAAARGKRLGEELLTALIADAKQKGIKQLLAVIADTGAEASLHLHEKLGFKEIGRMGKVAFKFDRWIGTVLLQKTIK